jgi:hypothetical protein
MSTLIDFVWQHLPWVGLVGALLFFTVLYIRRHPKIDRNAPHPHMIRYVITTERINQDVPKRAICRVHDWDIINESERLFILTVSYNEKGFKVKYPTQAKYFNPIK